MKQSNLYVLWDEYQDHLSALGAADSTKRIYEKIFYKLRDFMKINRIGEYSLGTGDAFLQSLQTEAVYKTQLQAAQLFIYRLNGLLINRSFPLRKKAALPVKLPEKLEDILIQYQIDAKKDGLKESSILQNLKICRWFLNALADSGCNAPEDFNQENISTAILALKSSSYLENTRMFLGYLFRSGQVSRNYSFLVPQIRRPEPIPSVYENEEIQVIEASVDRTKPYGKRDYAMLLLATRLGIRAGDIAGLTFSDLDFEQERICMVQQKTGNPLTLPMLPEIREALSDFISNERTDSSSPHVFLSVRPPYGRVSVQRIDKAVRMAIKSGKVTPGNRRQGAHALRSSLASSMVNDDVPYEVVRKTLGHTDRNAIKSYARLDIEQLRIYALEVPKAESSFAGFLAGGRPQ